MLRALAWMFVTTVPVAAQDNPAFRFKPNDRIVFLGDSITEQYQYSTYMELYLTTRYPTWNMTFLNAGIGGDTANGGAGRFQTHVLDEKPTVVTINFGMNDAGYGKFNPDANKQYVARTASMLEAAKKAGVRVALCSPNAVDRRVQPNFKLYLETQKEFYAPLKELATQHGVAFADQYSVTRAAVEAMEKVDPMAKVAKPYYDGFHTSPPGGLLMAHAILTQLKVGSTISLAEIFVESGKANQAGCEVTDIKVTDSEVRFTRKDAAIPMPVLPEWRSMLPYTEDLKDLNQYLLKVVGLPGGPDKQYEVKIDGKTVGTYSAKELGERVNLGNATTGPLYDQGKAVFDAIQKKNELVKQRFFGVVRFNIPDWLADVGVPRKAQELAKRMETINAAQTEIYKLAAPKAHEFTITPK